MTKDILYQYCDLQEEVKDLRRRINKLEEQIKALKESTVKDHVKGGYGGTQTFEIEGIPYMEYSKKRTRVFLYKAQLEYAEGELLEVLTKVEEYIQSIDNGRIRRIIRYRFIDRMTWNRVAMSMGGSATEDSVRKEFERFISK